MRRRPSSRDYTTLAEDLASHGYVVVAGAPTYSASVVVFPGGLLRDGSPEPYMYLASDLPDSPCDRECEEGDGWTRQIYCRSEHGSYHLTIGGTRHFDFTDYAALFSPILRMSGVLGTVDGRRALRTTEAYLLSFFDRYLKGEMEPLLRSASPRYPEVRFEARQGARGA